MSYRRQMLERPLIAVEKLRSRRYRLVVRFLDEAVAARYFATRAEAEKAHAELLTILATVSNGNVRAALLGWGEKVWPGKMQIC
jgi:hypothetical protein